MGETRKQFRLNMDEDEPDVVIEVISGDWVFLKACIEEDTQWDVEEEN